jgi:RNA polymerase sigma-32 factor
MTSLPVLSTQTANLAFYRGGEGEEFSAFLQRVNQAPLLTAEEEIELTDRFYKENDLQAAHALVFSHLRLVVRIAREYLGYRLLLQDLVQEGTVGLMHAVKRFDPDRGVRLATYAIWWIRASIHDFVLRSWSIVKIATTQLKRQLFFKLRQLKETPFLMTREEADVLAQKFGTDSDTILEVDSRMMVGDESLNRSVLDDGNDMIDMVADDRPNQETSIIDREQTDVMEGLLRHGMEILDPRERMILKERFIADPPQTLEALGQTLEVSRERVRQLERRALDKLRTFLLQSPQARELLAPA